jgi:3-hydroxy-3-methylglutaryl CoA synthase/uncharacterized OB-fold protein
VHENDFIRLKKMTTYKAEYGLLATSRYIPRLRLDRQEILVQHKWMAPGLRSLAKGQRSMASWDEDSVTMAVEAARLIQHSTASGDISDLTFSSTSFPFADRLNAGIVAAAIGLDSSVVLRDIASSPRAACTELGSILRQPNPNARHLLLASERRIGRPASTQEMIIGDGAAGVLIGTGDVIARLIASKSTQADLVDHFRQTGEIYDYGWEERWVREEGYQKIVVNTVKDCLTSAGITAAEISHFVMPAPLSRVNEMVAKRVGIQPNSIVSTEHESVGDLGSAQPLAMLDSAIRNAAPGAFVLVVAFGSGCDAILLQRSHHPCPETVPCPARVEKSYMKYLSFTGQIELEWGMRAEIDNKTALTAAWRDHARAASFEGSRCSCCGTVQFPRTRLCVNPECRAQDSQEPMSFSNLPAHVLSHTSDYLGYTPNPPFQFGHIDFEGGGRVMMEFADTDPDELQVGLPLRMVYRIKDFDNNRGFRRYFWKATPVREIDQGTSNG